MIDPGDPLNRTRIAAAYRAGWIRALDITNAMRPSGDTTTWPAKRKPPARYRWDCIDTCNFVISGRHSQKCMRRRITEDDTEDSTEADQPIASREDAPGWWGPSDQEPQ